MRAGEADGTMTFTVPLSNSDAQGWSGRCARSATGWRQSGPGDAERVPREVGRRAVCAAGAMASPTPGRANACGLCRDENGAVAEPACPPAAHSSTIFMKV